MTQASSAPPVLSHTAEQVRANDPDRYLSTLFAAAATREALFALYAFDHEIARVRHVVREPMAGLIRLQWWRDALEAIAAGQAPAHPVAEALRDAGGRLAPARPLLARAIEARARELEDEPLPDRAALEAHLEATGGAIVLAALQILGAADEPTTRAGREVGLAWGVASLLRAIPRDARNRRLMLPEALVERHGVDREVTFAGRHTPSLAGAVAELASLGQAHLGSAREQPRKVPSAALPALFPGSLAGDYLARLRRAGHDPFAQALHERAAHAPLRLLWRRARGVF